MWVVRTTYGNTIDWVSLKKIILPLSFWWIILKFEIREGKENKEESATIIQLQFI